MVLYAAVDMALHWLLHSSQQEVNRQLGLLAKHEEVRLFTRGLVNSGIVGKGELL